MLAASGFVGRRICLGEPLRLLPVLFALCDCRPAACWRERLFMLAPVREGWWPHLWNVVFLAFGRPAGKGRWGFGDSCDCCLPAAQWLLHSLPWKPPLHGGLLWLCLVATKAAGTVVNLCWCGNFFWTLGQVPSFPFCECARKNNRQKYRGTRLLILSSHLATTEQKMKKSAHQICAVCALFWIWVYEICLMGRVAPF
jgi:hypothetical protein